MDDQTASGGSAGALFDRRLANVDKRNDGLALMGALCAGLTIESSRDRRYV
jgi:hypothetical protein